MAAVLLVLMHAGPDLAYAPVAVERARTSHASLMLQAMLIYVIEEAS